MLLVLHIPTTDARVIAVNGSPVVLLPEVAPDTLLIALKDDLGHPGGNLRQGLERGV